jgi:membrane-associated protease RseP (regulator of RpoE activity)
MSELDTDANNPGTLTRRTPGALAPRSRRGRIPLLLFFLTCLSTFWVGVTNWQPTFELSRLFSGTVGGGLFDWMLLRQLLLRHWDQGLIYMFAVLAILLMHEMGHFVATLIYRIPATVPIFLPFPFNPIGTLGAVIGMEGTQADRRQIFDIGIAGPLAGLVIAIPMAIYGISLLDLTKPAAGQLALESPLAFRWIMNWVHVPGYVAGQGEGIWFSQSNPWLAAAWVGFLVTGLNMIPVGQLDGGHVTHCLFGRYAHWIAECIIVAAIAFMVWRGIPHLSVMVLLLLVMGTRHPPTRDDEVPLGVVRYMLGLTSLAIPFLCFPPNIFIMAP